MVVGCNTVLINLIIVLIVLGVILWLIDSLVPMDPTIRTIVRVLIALVGLLYVLRAFGVV